MPHAIVEYSQNLAAEIQAQNVSGLVHGVMTDCGLFQPADIKTRTYPTHDFQVGAKGSAGRFIHVTVYLLEGRTIEKKQALSQSLLDRLGLSLTNVDSITADVRELVKDVYRKAST